MTDPGGSSETVATFTRAISLLSHPVEQVSDLPVTKEQVSDLLIQSCSMGRLCLGFFRLVFGRIACDGLTEPIRSRAIARISFFWSNLVSFRFMNAGVLNSVYKEAVWV